MPTEPSAKEVIQRIYNDHQALLSTRDFTKLEIRNHEYSEKFVVTISQMGELLKYVHWDNEQAYKTWYTVLESLIDMTILAEKVPVYEFGVNYEGYGFRQYKHHETQHYIIQFIEGFIQAQNVRMSPLWWIELGSKVGLIAMDYE